MNQLIDRALRYSVLNKPFTLAELIEARSNQGVLARLGKSACYKTIGTAINYAVLGNYPTNPDFLSNGTEQLVFKSKNGQNVEKILINTIGSSQKRAEGKAYIYQTLSDVVHKHLGEFWLDTRFEPVRLPKALGRHAVMAVQPLIEPIEVFPGPAEVLDYSSDEAYVDQFKELLDRLAQLYKKTGMLPDLLGSGNIALIPPSEQIKIIDTIPETPPKLDMKSEYQSMTRRDVHMFVIGSWLKDLEELETTKTAV